MSQLPEEITNQQTVPQPESVSPEFPNNGVQAVESVMEDDAETVAMANNPKFIAILESSRARQKTEGGISLEEMRRRLGLDK